jgi:uncharacterized protein
VAVPTVQRPVWKAFVVRQLAAAADYARRGGGAVIVGPGGPARMLFRLQPDGTPGELFMFAILDLHKRKWHRVREGTANGLGISNIPIRRRWVVEQWLERDEKRKGPLRRMELDCVTCAACCQESKVFLLPEDLLLWKRSGRHDLMKKPFVERIKGNPMLRMGDDTRCQHLDGTKCGIYTLRPYNCRAFPAGSEPCLAARSDTFGLSD